jgi:uncharacterized surface anchored protein
MRGLQSVARRPSALFCLSKNCFVNAACRFLQEVGYEDVFNPDEINEIKDLYEKAQADLTEPVQEGSAIQKFDQKVEEVAVRTEQHQTASI